MGSGLGKRIFPIAGPRAANAERDEVVGGDAKRGGVDGDDDFGDDNGPWEGDDCGDWSWDGDVKDDDSVWTEIGADGGWLSPSTTSLLSVVAVLVLVLVVDVDVVAVVECEMDPFESEIAGDESSSSDDDDDDDTLF